MKNNKDKNYLIRKAEAKDIEDVLKLSKKLFDYEYQWHKRLNMEWTNSFSGKMYFEEKLHNKNSIFLIVQIEGGIIGYLTGSLIGMLPFRIDKSFAQIENMFVEKDFRHQGIGKSMFIEFEKWCEKQDVSSIKVKMVFQNDLAKGFYKNIGFIPYQEEYEKYIS